MDINKTENLILKDLIRREKKSLGKGEEDEHYWADLDFIENKLDIEED